MEFLLTRGMGPVTISLFARPSGLLPEGHNESIDAKRRSLGESSVSVVKTGIPKPLDQIDGETFPT